MYVNLRGGSKFTYIDTQLMTSSMEYIRLSTYYARNGQYRLYIGNFERLRTQCQASNLMLVLPLAGNLTCMMDRIDPRTCTCTLQ
jgi:hypothetical protein